MFAKYNITVFFILHDLSPYEKCQNFVLIRQLIRDLQLMDLMLQVSNLYY